MSKKKIKNYKVYIIGNIKSYDSDECKKRFLEAQKTLEKVGFVNIINPYELDSSMEILQKRRSSLMQLIDANAVYILSNVSINSSNTELQIAKHLKLIIIHDHT